MPLTRRNERYISMNDKKMYTNPILYADYSDPDVIRVGEDYYMIASSFTYLPGVPLLHSRDLVHWEIINHCVKKLPFGKYDRPSHGSGTWAPSLRFHEGVFYAFIPLVDEGILVARSESPYGEFRLNMLCESVGWIDPCPIWDDDGKAYMVFAYAESRCGIKHRLSMVEIAPDCSGLLGEPRVIFDGELVAPTTEGPKIYKKDDWYYILMPSGGVERGWQSCLRSKSIYGPYEYKVVMHQGNTRVNGPHQGGWVTTPDGRDWFIHFQDVGALGRITHLQPMCFVNDWPFIGQDQNGDGIGEPVEEWKMPVKGGTPFSIAQSDDFSSEQLGLQWQWQANPDESNYSLTEHPGHLRLYCRKNEKRENLLWYAPNVLTQIPQKNALQMTVKMRLESRMTGDFGGIGIVGHDYGYIGLYQSEEGMQIRGYQGTVIKEKYEGQARETCIYQKTIIQKEVWLRICLKEDQTYRLSYSTDGEHFDEADHTFPLNKATWTGAKLCLWACARENEETDGYCDYPYVDIR